MKKIKKILIELLLLASFIIAGIASASLVYKGSFISSFQSIVKYIFHDYFEINKSISILSFVILFIYGTGIMKNLIKCKSVFKETHEDVIEIYKENSFLVILFTPIFLLFLVINVGNDGSFSFLTNWLFKIDFLNNFLNNQIARCFTLSTIVLFVLLICFHLIMFIIGFFFSISKSDRFSDLLKYFFEFLFSTIKVGFIFSISSSIFISLFTVILFMLQKGMFTFINFCILFVMMCSSISLGWIFNKNRETKI